jgi:hypothetical protein
VARGGAGFSLTVVAGLGSMGSRPPLNRPGVGWPRRIRRALVRAHSFARPVNSFAQAAYSFAQGL